MARLMLPLSVALLGLTACGGSGAAPAATGGSVAPPVPVNTWPPTVAGTAQVGQTLTASTGSWSDSPTAYAYRWTRSGAPIAGATASSYLIVDADVGAALACSVTATNAGGSATAGSAATARVAAAPAASPATVNNIAEGDSITRGFGASRAAAAYPAVAVAAATRNPPVYYPLGGAGAADWYTPAAGTETIAGIVATSGIQVNAANGIATDFRDRGVYAGYDPGKALNVVSVMGGTNDGAVGGRIAIYRGLRRFIRQARARGYDRVVIGTLIARGDGGAASPENDRSFGGATLPLNQDIRALWNSDLDADGLADFGAAAPFDAAADANDTAYYSTDRLHLVDAGYATMGAVLTPVLDRVVAAAGVRVQAPATWSPFDKDAFLALSADSRTVTFPTGFADANIRGLPRIGPGEKRYFEVAIGGLLHTEIGVCSDGIEESGVFESHGATPATTRYAVGVTTGAGPGDDYNAIYLDGTRLAQGLAGDQSLLQIAVARGAVVAGAVTTLFWARYGGGRWNGSATADPATGAGGIDISGIGAGALPLYPLGYVRAPGGQITSRFAAAQMTGTIPAGFVALA